MKISVGQVGWDKVASPRGVTIEGVVSDILILTNPDVFLTRAYFEAPPSETMQFLENITLPALGDGIVDVLRLTTSAIASGNGYNTLSDTLSFEEFVAFSIDAAISDTLNFTDTVNYQFAALAAVAEVLKLDETVNLNSALNTVLIEMLQFGDLTSLTFDASILDQLNLSEQILGKIKAYESQLEVLELVEGVLEPAITFLMPTPRDALQLSDSREYAATVYNLLSDTISFGLRLVVDGDQYAGWVLNTRVLGASRATNWAFNSMHRVGNYVYGASSEGLYKLGGTDDAGTAIRPEVVSGLMNLADGRQTRLRQVYLGVSTDAKLVVKTVDSNGTERWYESSTPHTGMDTMTVQLGRKPQSRLWQMALVPQPATKFELSRVEMFPVILTRRRSNG